MHQKTIKIFFLKFVFNKFIYAAFFISLIIVLIANSLTQKSNKIYIICEFIPIAKDYTDEKYSNFFFNDVKNRTYYPDIRDLYLDEKKGILLMFYNNHKQEIYDNIYKILESQKLSYKFTKKDISINLKNSEIDIILSNNYNFFSYQKISDDDGFLVVNLVQTVFENTLLEKQAPLSVNISLKSIKNDFYFYHLITSTFFLTVLLNFIFGLIKNKKYFF